MSEDFTRKYLSNACEIIDAAMFSGDSFVERENRSALMYYMARWIKKLPDWEEIETDK